MVTTGQNSKKKYPVHSTRSSRLLSTKSVKQRPVPAVASATSATKKKMKPATPNEKCPSPSSKNRQELQAFSRSIQKQNHFMFSFNAELQDGDAEPQGQNCLPFRACFYARGVSALIAPTSMMNAGCNVVDRGHLLIQRELKTDYLRLAFPPMKQKANIINQHWFCQLGSLCWLRWERSSEAFNTTPKDASNCIHTVLSLQFRVWSRNLLRST